MVQKARRLGRKSAARSPGNEDWNLAVLAIGCVGLVPDEVGLDDWLGGVVGCHGGVAGVPCCIMVENSCRSDLGSASPSVCVDTEGRKIGGGALALGGMGMLATLDEQNVYVVLTKGCAGP